MAMVGPVFEEFLRNGQSRDRPFGEHSSLVLTVQMFAGGICSGALGGLLGIYQIRSWGGAAIGALTGFFLGGISSALMLMPAARFGQSTLACMVGVLFILAFATLARPNAKHWRRPGVYQEIIGSDGEMPETVRSQHPAAPETELEPKGFSPGAEQG